jgi:cytochrome c-type biogenesis protein
VVFTAHRVFVASVGRPLLPHARSSRSSSGAHHRLGLAFLGLVPGLQREWRIHKLPAAGLASAPVLGRGLRAVLGAVHRPDARRGAALAAVGGSPPGGDADRRVLPRPRAAVPRLRAGFRKLIGLHRAIRRNSVWVTRVGGAMLILVGLALATGAWGLSSTGCGPPSARDGGL